MTSEGKKLREALIEELEGGGLADQRIDFEIAWLIVGDAGNTIDRGGKRFVRYRSQDVPFEEWAKEHALPYTRSLDAAVSLYTNVPKTIPSKPRLCCADALKRKSGKSLFGIFRR